MPLLNKNSLDLQTFIIYRSHASPNSHPRRDFGQCINCKPMQTSCVFLNSSAMFPTNQFNIIRFQFFID